MLHSRKWSNPGNSPYTNENILAAMSDKFDMEYGELKEDIKELKGSQRSQIWVLIVAVVGAIIKFGFFPNP
jgi:hypothetical protein